MSIRDDIVKLAEYWAAPGAWKPDAQSMVDFFTSAGCEQVPSLSDAARSAALTSGCYLDKTHVRDWCGIWACSVLADSGVGVWWSLNQGKMLNRSGAAGVTIVGGYKGVQKGDLAAVNNATRHHFIVTAVNGNTIDHIDGNDTGNKIRTHRGGSIAKIWYYYRVNG